MYTGGASGDQLTSHDGREKECDDGRGPTGGALFTRSVVVGGGLLVGPCLQEV